MKLQGKLIGTNLAAVIVALVAATAVSIYQINQLAEGLYQSIVRNAVHSGKVTIDGIASRMTAYSSTLGLRADLAEALAAADRDALQAILVEEFKALSAIDKTLSTLEVTGPDGVVLLRGHNPGKWGDDKHSHPMVKSALAKNSVTSFTVSPTTGEVALDAIVPVLLDGTIVGTLKAGSHLRSETESIKRSTGTEVMFIVNGKVNASTIEAKDFTPPAALVSATETMLETVTLGGRSYSAAALPLHDGSGKQFATLMTLVDRSALLAAERNAMVALVSAALIVIMLIVVVQFGLTRKLVAPVIAMRDMMSEIAEGAGDMTRRITVQTKDEIGEIGDAFNRMMISLQDVVRKVQESALQIASASEQLSVITEQSSKSMDRQQGETEQVATAVNEMSATAQEVARSAQHAAEGARVANENAESGRGLVGQNMEAINELAEGMRRAVEVIRKLDEDSRNIGSVLEVISGVAEQTNLLALNAAIEAARAGEQGRGFAVVADEVRTLATRTQQSTEEINSMIAKLQDGASQAVEVITHQQKEVTGNVELSSRVSSSLDSILDAVRHIADMNSQIASAAEEQSAVAAEVDRTLINISQAGQETAEATSQTAQSSQSLAELAARLKGLVDNFKT